MHLFPSGYIAGIILCLCSFILSQSFNETVFLPKPILINVDKDFSMHCKPNILQQLFFMSPLIFALKKSNLSSTPLFFPNLFCLSLLGDLGYRFACVLFGGSGGGCVFYVCFVLFCFFFSYYVLYCLEKKKNWAKQNGEQDGLSPAKQWNTWLSLNTDTISVESIEIFACWRVVSTRWCTEYLNI